MGSMEYALELAVCVEAGLVAKSLKSLDMKSSKINDLALPLVYCID